MMMKIVPTTLLVTATVAFLVDAGPLQAEPRANDRVALRLAGQDCSAHYQAITRELHQVPGVTRVDMELIEDHVLIDRIKDQKTAGDFEAIINGIIPANAQCRAETMESCISAGPVSPTPSP